AAAAGPVPLFPLSGLDRAVTLTAEDSTFVNLHGNLFPTGCDPIPSPGVAPIEADRSDLDENFKLSSSSSRVDENAADFENGPGGNGSGRRHAHPAITASDSSSTTLRTERSVMVAFFPIAEITVTL